MNKSFDVPISKESIQSFESLDSLAKSKRIYIKFSSQNLIKLNDLYQKRAYPSKKEIKKLYSNLNEPLKKIENWFKHKRRTDMKKGTLTFSKKKIFSIEDKKYLMEKFLESRNPSYGVYKKMSNEIDCPIKHLKNWFSYKRKVHSKTQVDIEKEELIKNENKDSLLDSKIIKPKEEEQKREEISLKEKEMQESTKVIQKIEENCEQFKSSNFNWQQIMNDYNKLQLQNLLMAATLNRSFLNNYQNNIQFQLNQQIIFPNPFLKLHF